MACPLFLYGKARLLSNVYLTIHRALDCIGSFLSPKNRTFAPIQLIGVFSFR